MTREERRKWFCQRCGGCVDNGKAKYKCPPLNDDMYAWEVGYKDAVDEACDLLRRSIILEGTTIERFKKYMYRKIKKTHGGQQ